MDDPILNDQEYQRLADACLERAAAWLEDFDADELDYATSDGVVTLEFADGQRYVLNRQAAAHQMWFAAGARAWHYDWNSESGLWLDDRDGHELFQNVVRCVGDKLGRALAAPR